MTGSKGLTHWTSETVCECSEIAGSPQLLHFLQIDLVKGYHQIPVSAADIPKTAIIPPFALFEYLFTIFGLSDAVQTFERMMDHTIDGLEGCLHTWTTLVWVLQTDKHTFLIWKLFATLWLPIVLPSTLRNAFLESPP
jgi:hypothetical protein